MGEFYISKTNPSKDYADRYRNCNILTDVETGETLLSTREIQDTYATSSDIYHRIDSHELNRLDKLAYEYYKNPSMWWVIAEANNIFDPFSDIPSGTLLRIPSVTNLYGNNGVLL